MIWDQIWYDPESDRIYLVQSKSYGLLFPTNIYVYEEDYGQYWRTFSEYSVRLQ